MFLKKGALHTKMPKLRRRNSLIPQTSPISPSNASGWTKKIKTSLSELYSKVRYFYRTDLN